MRAPAGACLLLVPFLATGLPKVLGAQATRPGAIMGWWHGTSTCVKASWNAACKDEVVVYEFAPSSPDSIRSTVHAFKLVAGQRDSMGALPVTFMPDDQAWNAEIATARGDIRWSFRLQGESLLGQLVLLPGMQVARHVVALRGQGQASAGAPHD